MTKVSEFEGVNYNEMEAGRELDALVAEYVMGFKWYHWLVADVSHRFIAHPARLYGTEGVDYAVCDIGLDFPLAVDWHRVLPKYSADISAAWRVAQHFFDKGYHIIVNGGGTKPLDWEGDWHCSIGRDDDWYNTHAYGDNAPLAICRAALKVVVEASASPSGSQEV